jgi:flagellar L-ring protein precursor FlgH
MRSWPRLAIALSLAAVAVPGPAHAQSLWREGAPGATLFTDHRALVANDIVTIVISEQAMSSRSANTTTSKDTTRDASLGWKGPGQTTGTDMSVNLAGKAEHTGKGSIDRTDRLSGQIPARVVKVLDNGNLLIEGRRAMLVNDETQVLTISGIVRADDITASNTVLSSQIADAEIQMTGKGVLAEAQRPGVLYRLLDWLHLF